MIFIDNKYSRIYFSIINRAKERLLENTYFEKHHIIPKSLGGSNKKENLVKLTAREHFICHLLLTKMTSGDAYYKMINAAWLMSIKDSSCINSYTYEQLKIKKSMYQKTRTGILSSTYGKKTGRTSKDFTDEWRQNISNSKKGKPAYNKGVPRSAETKEKISYTRKQRSKDSNWNIRPACSEEKAAKIKKANTGKRWVHNLLIKERKYIPGEDVYKYLSLGWMLGLGPKTLKE
jgi:hypothetical protein